ncbi:DUF4352 domain-containing protein [Fictibacillus aquaticus]|uniref:DUF4352 domain-containing protein n=1 Tax=Fictibacillus aquaticus TaxID=2021314 RepID=A0A235F9E8_9BACL|nr:DUF4352 domain-containing protein [Fictibacillus aquaticus]OYD57335.1 hypothetical protein CGZ90_11680 [Fictibacillus aquaticus]
MRQIMILLMISLFTIGCTAKPEESNPEKEPKKEQQQQETEKKPETEKEAFGDSPQAADDSVLPKPGTSNEDDDGVVTLLKEAKLNETKTIGPIKMKVANVRVIEYKPSVDLVDFFHGYTHKDEKKFPYVRVNVVFENTSDDPIQFAPVSEVKTDQGQKVTWENDFYIEELNGEIKPGEKKMGSLGFIIDDTDPAKMKSLTLKTSEAFDKNKKKLAEPASFEVKFK